MAWELTNATNMNSGKFATASFAPEDKESYVRSIINVEAEAANNELMTQLDIANFSEYNRSKEILTNASRYGFVLSEGIGLDPSKQLEYRKEQFIGAYSEYMYNETRLKDLYGDEYEHVTEGND